MKIIIFDTETTGLPVREGKLEAQPHVTQFAAISYEFNPQTRHLQEISRYNQLIKPPISIPPESTRITGISDQTVVNMPSFSSLTPEIQALFSASDVAVAHNIEFDKLILSNEFERLGLPTNFLPAETYCSMERTRDLCKLPGRSGGYKAPKLMELHQFLLGERFEEAHNALKDVEALGRCVKVLLTQGFYLPSIQPGLPKKQEVMQESLF
jgi:DNA polymerase III epsilon subunit-like protein